MEADAENENFLRSENAATKEKEAGALQVNGHILTAPLNVNVLLDNAFDVKFKMANSESQEQNPPTQSTAQMISRSQQLALLGDMAAAGDQSCVVFHGNKGLNKVIFEINNEDTLVKKISIS